MIKNFLLFIVICLPLINQAQNIMPVFRGKSTLVKKDNAQLSKIEKEIDDVKNKMNKTTAAGLTKAEEEKQQDSLLIKMALLIIKKDSLNMVKDSVSRYPLITFYGSAAVGAGTDFLSTITSTGQLNAIVNPFGKTFVGIGANLLFANPDKGGNKDSVDFKSLMFPETGKFGVLASILQKIDLNKNGRSDTSNEFRQHFLIPQVSFAYRRVTIDSTSTGFKVLNYNVGIKYQVEGMTKDSNRIVFSVMPYWHYFNIPNEDVTFFQKTVNDSLFTNFNKGAAIQALGIKTTLQYNSFVFFFDIRQTLNTATNMADTNPFKGTLVNVGFSTNIKLTLGKKKKEDDN